MCGGGRGGGPNQKMFYFHLSSTTSHRIAQGHFDNATRVVKVVTVLCPSPHICSVLNWRCVGKEVG